MRQNLVLRRILRTGLPDSHRAQFRPSIEALEERIIPVPIEELYEERVREQSLRVIEAASARSPCQCVILGTVTPDSVGHLDCRSSVAEVSRLAIRIASRLCGRHLSVNSLLTCLFDLRGYIARRAMQLRESQEQLRKKFGCFLGQWADLALKKLALAFAGRFSETNAFVSLDVGGSARLPALLPRSPSIA